MYSKSILAASVVVVLGLVTPGAQGENLPPRNPALADSFWPIIHGGSDGAKISPVAGPMGKSRALRPDELKWKATGPMESLATGYSGVYPDGRRVMWVGTHQQLIKLDADTLETLATYVVREGTFIGPDDIERIDRKYDEYIANGDRQAIFDQADRHIGSALRDEQMGNCYSLLTRKNERLFYFKDRATGKRFLRFYGDAVEGDASSEIVMRRQWEIPTFSGKPFIPFATNMTHDGWIILASNTGQILAVTTDFSSYQFLDLVQKDRAGAALDAMQSFVRNGIAIDDRNGILVVTKDFMARVQWTGKTLSLDPADGAWTATYPTGPRGSGTSPALMGWGDEDHLVIIADGENKNLVAFWRDRVPSDWKGIAGYDRRVAGIAPIGFGPEPDPRARIENAPSILGYGLFFANEVPSKDPPPQGASVVKTFLASAISAGLSGTEAIGGTKWVWDPKQRVLRQQWNIPAMLTGGMCTPSSTTRVLYCISRHDGDFHLEGFNWDSGDSLVRYRLGNSVKYFPWNNLVVAPNGAVDLFNWLGMGILRIQPKP